MTKQWFKELLRDANRQASMFQECMAAIISGSVSLTAPNLAVDVDQVTHIDYFLINTDRAHGGLVLAVRRVKQAAGEPTVMTDVRPLDEVRDRYRSGDLRDPNGRVHFEQLIHKAGLTL